jgi:hypothetical protein
MQVNEHDSLSGQSPEKGTLLHHAAWLWGHPIDRTRRNRMLDSMSVLLRAGADCNALNHMREPPLHTAVEVSHMLLLL